MRNKYTINYFIKKFKAIPEKFWITHTFKHETGARCALGHCGMQNADQGTPEGEALKNIFQVNGYSIFRVNDSQEVFTQETPRARVLAALRKFSKA